ncbi:MAG: cytochrome d ubiquinol oxidase subunit II [Chlorobi bacterium]|nr:cytochrome d ubiquinol oxidase subunit II [Chlorobiota bacterium]
MTAAISYLFLQHYWWIIISLLGSLLVFLLFVQGGQTFILSLGKNDVEKTMIVNAFGRKWEFTFTTLVTFGGAFFASFPLFYATSFGGAYWVWVAILFSFIIQAVSYEFRSKPGNFLGAKTYEVFLFINGLLGPLLLGIAVATFFTGSVFSLDEMNHVIWQSPWKGLEAVTNPMNVILGLAILFLARVLGLLYLLNSIDHQDLLEKVRKKLVLNTVIFLVFFLTFVVWLLFATGYAYDDTGKVFMEKNKYLHNLFQMPLNTLFFLLGVISVLWGLFISLFRNSDKGIWWTGAGTVLTVFALFILVGFNRTSFYPSSYDLSSSLTIENASSSKYTLKTMFFVSFMVPFVVWYIWVAWKAINKKKITEEEMKEESHIY